MDNLCHICAQEVPGPNRKKIFAFGRCNHHVCYVCSARLRAICDQFECPICRKKLDFVIFSENKQATFKKFKTKDCSQSDKYKIYFESKAIEVVFNNLLKYECQICSKTFESLEDHKDKSAGDESNNTSKKNATSSSKTIRDKSKTGNNNNSNNNTIRANKSNGSVDTSGGSSSSNSGGSARETHTASPSSTARRLEEDGPPGLLEPATVARHVFDDVYGLKTHLNYVHKLRLCDFCLNHNKLFSFEFSYYDAPSLSKHIKEGEPKTSHRGHPKCDLCPNIFFNREELLVHMSREHYPCHLCGARESTMAVYFTDFDNLRNHFKDKHILCQRDNCRSMPLTSAFDSEIEYNLHLVSVHGQRSSTIALESVSHEASQNSTSTLRSMRQSLPRNAAVVSTGRMAIANSQRRNNDDPNAIRLNQPIIRPQRLPTASEFPVLGQDTTSTRPVSQPSASQSSSTRPASRPIQSTLSQRLVAGPSSAYGRMPVQLNEMDFPPLPEAPKPKAIAGKMSQKSKKRFR